LSEHLSARALRAQSHSAIYAGVETAREEHLGRTVRRFASVKNGLPGTGLLIIDSYAVSFHQTSGGEQYKQRRFQSFVSAGTAAAG
jgi:hypothetical protein